MNGEIATEIWISQFQCRPDVILRLPTGSCNYVFLVEDGRGKFILRLGTAESDFAIKGSLYWIEYLQGRGLPIPRLVCSQIEHNPPFIVLNYSEGCDLGEVYPNLTENQKRAIVQQLVAARAILAATPMADGYGFLSRHDDPDRLASWRQVVEAHLERSRTRIRKIGLFDPSLVDKVSALLPIFDEYFDQIKPLPFFDDATTKNVLVQDGRFNGIIDLDWICFGDHLYTIALTKMSLIDRSYSLSYIDYWVEAEKLTQLQMRILDFYVLVFCVDFLSEKGQTFNKTQAEWVSQAEIARYLRLYDDSLAVVVGEQRNL